MKEPQSEVAQGVRSISEGSCNQEVKGASGLEIFLLGAAEQILVGKLPPIECTHWALFWTGSRKSLDWGQGFEPS